MDAFEYPWDMAPPPPAAPAVCEELPAKAKPRGRRPALLTRAAPLTAGTAPDWLYHHLTISGPAETVATFAAAARGAGVTPWQLDLAAIEETVFVRAVPSLARSVPSRACLVAQPASRRNLTVEGCRILARQFRERIELRQARAAALVGQSLACPFDLHALLPVPASILQLGPGDPVALAWLAAHWGITDRLRVFHRWRNPARRDHPPHEALAGAAISAHAAAG